MQLAKHEIGRYQIGGNLAEPALALASEWMGIRQYFAFAEPVIEKVGGHLGWTRVGEVGDAAGFGRHLLQYVGSDKVRQGAGAILL